MGLGSDSEPVSVNLLGQNVYLADSMQFILEYFLRFQENLAGTYYISSSFRGEDPDATHLNQFYHVECELLGNMDNAISIAEGYLAHLTKSMLKKHSEIILNTAGTLDHVTSMLSKLNAKTPLPRVPLDQAILMMPSADCFELVQDGQPQFGRKLTRKGERVLIEKYGGAVWLTEMDHLGVPFYQAYVEGTGRRKAKAADLLFGLGAKESSASALTGQTRIDSGGHGSIMAAQTRALVSGQWLADAIRNNLIRSDIRILDTSWYLPKLQRNTKAEFAEKHIPGSSFFDIDECSDRNSEFDHMLPAASHFSRLVSVLDGGMKNWLADGLPVTSELLKPERRDFTVTMNRSWVKSYEEVLENMKTEQVQVVDARSAGRFRGIEPEPREGTLPGHFPGAINMPFTSFMDSSGKELGEEDLSKLFKEAGVNLEKPLWATCGSGVTACHVVMAAHMLGHPGVCVYDGSWSEWFQRASPEHIISEGEGKKM
ncbi:unnamed protein product [Lampetra planeri]